MTLKEAYQLLDTAPRSHEPSNFNPFLNEEEAVRIVRKAVAILGRPEGNPCGPDDVIDALAEKRVWQVVKNQKWPSY